MVGNQLCKFAQPGLFLSTYSWSTLLSPNLQPAYPQVSDWWEEYVYLRGRSPIMVNSNYYAMVRTRASWGSCVPSSVPKFWTQGSRGSQSLCLSNRA